MSERMTWWQRLRVRQAGRSHGGEIRGASRADAVPFVAGRGAVALPRAAYDALGPDVVARINSVSAWSGTYPDVTIVEPDGTLTEIEGTGP